MTFPHAFMTCVALIELWQERPQPGEIWSLHYDVYDVYRWAFVVSHLWLTWAVIRWRRGSTPFTLRVLVILVGVELGLVYSIVAFLRVRGFPLDFGFPFDLV